MAQKIEEVKLLVSTAKQELSSAIASKASTATVNKKFNELQSAITALQDLSDDYVAADSALKEELTALIANTKAEIIDLILAGDKANADAFEKEIAKLRAEIEALQNAMNDELAKLREEMEAMKNATNEDIKEAEKDAKVLPTVVASTALTGEIALLAWLIIKRKLVK